MKKRKIIIDTDPGHDDAMALMLACLSSELDVLALTTTCGNSTIENTTRNARFIINYIDRNDIPIFSGAAKPLRRDLVQAVVHGKSGLEGIDPKNAAKLTGDAPEQIVKMIKTNPHDITLVTLGPLTNVAQAISSDPQTMRLLKNVVIMGGAVNVPGNQSAVAEFNMFVDPEAADIVMRFPIEKLVVPLDACNEVQLRMEDVRRVQNKSLRQLLTRMVRPYMANMEKDIGTRAAIMYDPLTIFTLLEPESCRRIQKNVVVETEGVVTRGMTVVDRRTTSKATPNATIVMHADDRQFVERFVTTLNRSE